MTKFLWIGLIGLFVGLAGLAITALMAFRLWFRRWRKRRQARRRYYPQSPSTEWKNYQVHD